MGALIGLGVAVVIIAIFTGVLLLVVKHGNARFDKMFATVGTAEREVLKNTDYRNYDEEPNCFVVLCNIGELQEKKGKMEVGIIYFRHETQQFMADSFMVEKEILQQRQLRVGSQILVVFKTGEIIPTAWRIL